MSRFVEECQREWKRLGVSEATANEMAADLEADLAEAEADGVSPEEVLGNGYFDAGGFAAEWARARGVVGPNADSRTPTARGRFLLRPLPLVAGALCCLVAAALGLLILLGGRASSVSLAVASFRAVPRPLPGMLFRPGRFAPSGPGAPLALLGLILLVGGLVGVGVTLWLWRARASHPDPSEADGRIGMPTYF